MRVPATREARAKSRKSARAPAPDRSSPGLLRWLLMTLSIPLPWIGGAVAFLGVSRLVRGDQGAGWLIGLGVLLVVLDIVGDLWLHRDIVAHADEPSLNARGQRHVGKLAVLEKPIAAGRGRIRLGDSLWAVEGSDLPAGTRVRVVASRGAVLLVSPADAD